MRRDLWEKGHIMRLRGHAGMEKEPIHPTFVWVNEIVVVANVAVRFLLGDGISTSVGQRKVHDRARVRQPSKHSNVVNASVDNLRDHERFTNDCKRGERVVRSKIPTNSKDNDTTDDTHRPCVCPSKWTYAKTRWTANPNYMYMNPVTGCRKW